MMYLSGFQRHVVTTETAKIEEDTGACNLGVLDKNELIDWVE
jgi:hypothetical protein